MQYPFRTMIRVVFLAAAALAAYGHATRADDDHEHRKEVDDDERDDRDWIRDALGRGEILPLPQLRAVVLERWPGEIVALSAKRKHGRFRYEFRVLRPDGRLTEVEVDAADGTILEVENE